MLPFADLYTFRARIQPALAVALPRVLDVCPPPRPSFLCDGVLWAPGRGWWDGCLGPSGARSWVQKTRRALGQLGWCADDPFASASPHPGRSRVIGGPTSTNRGMVGQTTSDRTRGDGRPRVGRRSISRGHLSPPRGDPRQVKIRTGLCRERQLRVQAQHVGA